jgi:ribulose-5-phosphate 4-epimerase/fuculose-1-phosphate aldolase
MAKSKSANTRFSRGNRTTNQAANRAIKEQLIMAGKVLVAEGQDDFTRGHISFRLPDNPNLFFMKAHSIGLDEITMQNILTIDLEGNVVVGAARRHSEVYIHSEIFKARPDINCVIHTHPSYSIALSATGRALKQPAGRAVLRGARVLRRHQDA